MITFHTGLPGNGKTLFTIDFVLKNFPDRPVYYAGIPELKTSWIELDDPDKWYETEQGAVIIIDEAQQIFPTVSPSAPKPPKISEFETHRHKGFDVILMTQDAMLVDSRVRRLAGCHRHLMRPLGMERANVYEWQKVAKPNDYHDKQDAVRTTYKYNKDVYELYKSSEVHTHKRSIPAKPLIVGGGSIALIAACGVYGYGILDRLSGNDESPPPEEITELAHNYPQENQQAVPAQFQDEQRVLFEAHRMNDKFSPVVSGHPYTAPFYQTLLQPRTLPKISGCGEVVLKRAGHTETFCRCNTQQGTTFPMDIEVCQYYVKNGWFDFTGDPDKNQHKTQSSTTQFASTNPFSPK